MSGNNETVKTINGIDVTGEWLTKFQALTVLEIQDSTLFVACKRHEWLAQAVQRGYRHPETGTKITRIKTEAVLRYLNDHHNSNGGGSGDHPGQFKYTTWLAEDEVEKAEKALAKVLGREVKVDRLYVKKAAEAETTEAVAETPKA